MKPEHCARIGPCGQRLPTRSAGEQLCFFKHVFVTVFGMDHFIFCHIEASTGDNERNVAPGNKMHFDPAKLVVPDGPVFECIQGDIAIEFAVYPHDQVEIERRGHTCGIVIRILKQSCILSRVNANNNL